MQTLTANYRVVVHDHLGFGLSDKPANFSYSLIEQAEVAFAVWQNLGVQEGHLVAHDYGTSIATEILARQQRGALPVALNSLTLCNGSVHIELAHLTLAQKLMRNRLTAPLFVRLVSRAFFRRRIRDILGKPESVSDQELDALWLLMNKSDGRKRLPRISGYIDERRRFWHRWIGALQDSNLPTHLLWGRRDPIAVPAIAHRLLEDMPHAKLTFMEQLGHYPMLEDHVVWSRHLLEFIDHQG